MMGRFNALDGVRAGSAAPRVCRGRAVVPLLPGYDPYSAEPRRQPRAPVGGVVRWTASISLGTDTLGRDILSRLALAGQVSLLIGLAAVAVSLVIGVVLGLVAGFFRGWVENVIMGLADLQLSIPRVLLLIAVTAIVGTERRQPRAAARADELGRLRPRRARHGAQPARARIRAVGHARRARRRPGTSASICCPTCCRRC